MWQVSGSEHDIIPPSGVEAPLGECASSLKKTERPEYEIVVEYIIFYNIIVDEGVDL